MENSRFKFRAWNENPKIMMDYQWLMSVTYEDLFLNEDAVLMQYTGLKDKNGKEVYEGDLLKVELDWGYGLAKIISEVYFKDGAFRVKALNSHEDTFICELPYLEVIGNIYENPELLDQ